MKPKCKLCGSPHWTYEEHKITSALDEVRKVGASVLRNQPPTVTKPRVESVTIVSPETGHAESYPLAPISNNVSHGGAREGSGRKKEHKTNAERQRAYRERSR